VLSSLRILYLEFLSSRSRPDRKTQSLPPPKRSVLPALYYFDFKGVAEYLEDLVTFIDAPQLKTLKITLVNQIDFDCPHLARLINCTATLRALNEARVRFEDDTASINLRYRTSPCGFDDLPIEISCGEPDLQLWSVKHVCNSSLHPLSTVEDLYIDYPCSRPVWKDYAIENTLLVQLLLPFTAVKNLYLSKEFAPGIAAALQELVGSRITEVLPSLQNISVRGLKPSRAFRENIRQFDTARQLSGHPGPAISIRNEPLFWNQKIIKQFVAARQLSDHPISISDWYKDSDTESI
jgi:hypothetical protein